MIIEMIGWIGFICILIGYTLNAKKKLSCFGFWGVGNILFLIYAFLISALPQVAMAIFVLLTNIYGYKIWKKEITKIKELS